MKVSIKFLTALPLIFAQGISVMAFQNQKLNTMEPHTTNIFQTFHKRISNPWLQSENPAGLALAEIPETGNSYFFGDMLQGSFYRPQEAEALRRFGFHSERFQSLKNLKFKGNFTFHSINEDNRNWSNVNNPFNGNPYILASERGGDWKRQFYQLGFGASTEKLFNLFYFGLDINYEVQSGARQNDPRPLNNANLIEVKKGFVFPLGNRSQFGIHGLFSNLNEEISITVSNTDEQQRWFHLRGLAEYITGLALGSYRAYNGKVMGGGMQYVLNLDQTMLMGEFSVKQTGIDAADGTSVIQHGGEFDETTTMASLQMVHPRSASKHWGKLFFELDQREGKEHSQTYDLTLERWLTFATTLRYYSSYMKAGFDYKYYRMVSATDFDWMFGMTASYVSDDARFLLPFSTMSTQSVNASLMAAKSFTGAKQSFYLRANAGLRMLLNNNLDINPEISSSGRTVIVNNVVIPDFAWQTTDFLNSGLVFGYQRNLGRVANQVWMSVSINRINPFNQVSNLSFLEQGRNFIEFKLGLVM